MATFLDFSLVGFLGPIFMFLFVFVIVYGLLNKVPYFKDVAWSNGVNAIIALVTAFFVVGTPTIYNLLSNFAPWFTVILILIFMMLFVFQMFTGPDTDMFSNAIKKPAVQWTIFVVFIILAISSFAGTFGQDLLEDQVGEQPREQVLEETGDGEIIIRDGTDSSPSSSGSGIAADGSTASGDFGNNVLQTIINPKVLGMILFMLISFFAILLLARNTFDPDTPR